VAVVLRHQKHPLYPVRENQMNKDWHLLMEGEMEPSLLMT